MHIQVLLMYILFFHVFGDGYPRFGDVYTIFIHIFVVMLIQVLVMYILFFHIFGDAYPSFGDVYTIFYTYISSVAYPSFGDVYTIFKLLHYS